MTWIVRTYETTSISAFNQQKVALEKGFESKSDAERYRAKLKCYSELFKREIDLSICNNTNERFCYISR